MAKKKDARDTKVAERMDKKASSKTGLGVLKAVGGVILGVSAAKSASKGHVISAVAKHSVSGDAFESAGKDFATARSTRAKSTAIDALVARSRGGSAGLRAAGVSSAKSKPYAGSKNAKTSDASGAPRGFANPKVQAAAQAGRRTKTA